MKLNDEARVGLFTLIGLALILAIGLFINRVEIGGPKGYTLKIFFETADGLAIGNQLRYAGVQAGRVEAINLLPNGVEAVVRVNPGVKVPVGSYFSLGLEGLMGTRYVGIYPPTNPTDEFLKPGTMVTGVPAPSVDAMMASATRVLENLESVVVNFNDIVGAEETKAAIQMTMINLGVISENLRVASESVNRMSTGSEADVRAIVSNLRATSEDMKRLVRTADDMLTTVADDGKTAEEIKLMLRDMQSVVHRMDNITAAVEKVATDPATIENVQQTLQNANDASSRINRILGGGRSQPTQSTQDPNNPAAKGKPTSAAPKFFQGGLELSYSPDERNWRGDADITIGNSRFVRMGVQDIGEDNHVLFQGGRRVGAFSYRAGIFESKLGAGVDWQATDWLKFSLDGYDPNDFHWRARGEAAIGDDTSIYAQVYGRRRATSTYLGVRQNF
ncbi:MAG: MCE family protein [Negativicutes bacterium]|nr:MCE family protein [Negativicutes bacterium]